MGGGEKEESLELPSCDELLTPCRSSPACRRAQEELLCPGLCFGKRRSGVAFRLDTGFRPGHSLDGCSSKAGYSSFVKIQLQTPFYRLFNLNVARGDSLKANIRYLCLLLQVQVPIESGKVRANGLSKVLL